MNYYPSWLLDIEPDIARGLIGKNHYLNAPKFRHPEDLEIYTEEQYDYDD